MSIKKYFENNKKNSSISKYLKKSGLGTLGDGIESAAHLSESLKKRDAFVPKIDYSDPRNFAKFASAAKYYKDSFTYITSYYPYDGSGYEKTKFYNELNSFEKYIFNHKYTKSTGYVQLGYTYGTSYSNSSGYWLPDSAEYIQAKGGPHYKTKYSVVGGRTNNFEFGGPSGSTVEFFFKKSQGIPEDEGQSVNQVIFDLWNGNSADKTTYGRTKIEIISGSEDRFYVSMMSGSAGFITASVPSAGGLNLTDNTWKNYSFVFDTNRTIPVINFYINGECYESNITGTTDVTQLFPGGDGQIGLVTGSLVGNIGALRYRPYGEQHAATGSFEGNGKLSASIDEFRFWKAARNGEEVGRYWFDNINGGTDKHDANVALGVYYKFNEGITQTSSIDSVVLDYSGRISNGAYVGYDATNSRSTASAINALNLESIREPGDPVVRISNPQLVDTKDTLVLQGQNHDYHNSARLVNNMPNWIIEEDEQSAGELNTVLQIVGNKFDEIHAQITSVSDIKNIAYVSGSATGSAEEFPHNDRLVENLGLEAPEIFENIGTLAQFLQRDEQINFDQRLVDIKNTIYKNIYNNLTDIFKSKGTEKAIRNFIRCLGVGEEIIALNIYGDQVSYVLEDNYKVGASNKKFIDFSGLTSQTSSYATVYQYYDSAVPSSQGLITSASTNEEFAFTLQSDVLFPDKSNKDLLDYNLASVVSASLMGFHTPDDPDVYRNDLTWATIGNDYGLQLYFVKSPAEFAEITSPAENVKDGYFCLTNRTGEVLLTSSIFSNVYDNKNWNIAMSVRPQKYSFAEGITGTTLDPSGLYTVELCGYHYDTGILRDSFVSSASMNYTSGSNSLVLAKRLYMGAHRENYTGSILTATDVRATSLRYWTDYLSSDTIKIHAREVDSYGRIKPNKNTYGFQSNNPGVYIPQIETLALNWDFSNITGSDSSGQFNVTDFSSGSVVGYPANYQNTPFSDLNLRQHTGLGDLFAANSTPVRKEYVYASRLQGPDYIASSEMIKVLTAEEETFGFDSRPANYFFAVEKSMYRSISNRMLEMLASIDEYNQLMGEPINKYRPSYKRMEKLREIFFRRVRNDIPDLQKYLDFYKWLDSAMNRMIEQLLPASARTAPEVRTLIESHVLERQKISYKYPQSYKRVVPNPLGRLDRGWGPGLGGWRANHAPLPESPLNQNKHCFWWKNQVYPTNTNVSSSIGAVNDSRIAIYKANQRLISGSQIVNVTATARETFVGGVNSLTNKTYGVRDFTFGEFGGFSASSSLFVFTFGEDRCEDFPELKPNLLVPFQGVKDNVYYDGNLIAPFTAISSSVKSGYRSGLDFYGLQNIDLTNFHQDGGTPGNRETPMQGPFTERFVGGIQARHNAPFMSGTADRSEEYLLSLSAGYASAPFNVISDGAFDKNAYDEKTLIFTVGGVTYSATVDKDVTTGNSTKSVIGTSDASSTADIAEALAQSLNLAITEDGLPITAVQGEGALTYRVTVTSTLPGAFGNDIEVKGTWNSTSLLISGLIFTGGVDFAGSVDTLTIQATPKGQYLRGAGSKSPLNIRNIKSFTGSAPSNGVSVIGNYVKNYEVVQTNDRSQTNLDFVFNNSNYFTGSIPTAFLTTPARRVLGLTGSVDYAAPRQIAGRRKTQSVIVNRFASPGSKEDSKQQFRDVAADQVSPNSPLPFRNMGIRKPYLENLAASVKWGGFSGSSEYILNNFNYTSQVFDMNVNALTLLNAGVKEFGFASGSIAFSTATYINGDTLTLNIDGYSYSAALDNSVAPAASSATVIGIDGVSSDTTLAQAIMYSISSWLYGGGATLAVPLAFGGGGVVGPFVILQRTTQGSSADGVTFGGTLTARSGVTVNPFAGTYFKAQASKYHKTQRNTTRSIRSYEASSDGVSYYTSSLRDNDFVTRPIPQADRTEWFMSLSGSGAETYNNYILSGSRYPANITVATSSLTRIGFAAQGAIGTVSGTPAHWNNTTIAITGSSGTAVLFVGDSGSPLYDNARTAGTPVVWDWGMSDASTGVEVGLGLMSAIDEAQAAGDLLVSSFLTDFSGVGLITVTQEVVGTAGNTTIQGSAADDPAVCSLTSFTRGTNTADYDFGSSIFSNMAGKNQFPWSGEVGFVPWSQISNHDSNQSRYLTKNNIYEFYNFPDAPAVSTPFFPPSPDRAIFNTTTRTSLNRTGQSVPYRYLSRYTEPPVTSKYKPLVHHIKSYRGTPEKSEYDTEVETSLRYSYGNMLMGFANKGINNKTIKRTNFQLGEVKRPYEILRDNYTARLSERIDGVRLIKLTAYPETIYPKNIYTYLSGTRTRLAFKNNFWRNDILTGSSTNLRSFNVVSQLYSGDNVKRNNRQNNRISASFYGFETSLGYTTQASEQESKTPALTPSGVGSGSMWPMDSFLYSDSLALLGADAASQAGLPYPEIGTVLTASAATLPAGELMMPTFGAIFDNRAGSTGVIGAYHTRAQTLNAQYVYTVPCEIPTGSHGNNYALTVTSDAPGGLWTRPSWTAGRDRKYVGGESRGEFAPTRYPFYNSYEDYVEDVKRVGKDESILPAFRVSEHIEEYGIDARESRLPLIRGTLQLTGASEDNFSTTNTEFMGRYAETDDIEFLKYFMRGEDLEFNKYPRQFELSSQATLKLLPYDGFYPASRTLQLANLFGLSYAAGGQYSGKSPDDKDWGDAQPEKFRTLLQPFYAPGILYNSIKSGIAVNYPVKRANRNVDQYLAHYASGAPTTTYEPLHGVLSGTLVSTPTDDIPGGNRRPTVNQILDAPGARGGLTAEMNTFFWSDKLPFESILDPATYVAVNPGFGTALENVETNTRLYLDCTASVGAISISDERLYRGAISNFLASVPQFFLRERDERLTGKGYMTKFVANFSNSERVNSEERTPVRKRVDPNGVYMMEIGLTNTSNFNMYSNPYSFGVPTATGSEEWDNSGDTSMPSGTSWPLHRGEFAPFTPPHYYGPSVVRLTYTPTEVGENGTVSLEEILYGNDLRVEYINESGSYYDFSSGSYTDMSGNTVETTGVSYGWNRAWQNRMDIDASLVIDNNFPIDGGGTFNPMDEGNPNRWVIMPKWECPILDFPTAAGDYNFSSSVNITEYTTPTYGMWHQYGVMPAEAQGTFMFLRDVSKDSTELRLLGTDTTNGAEARRVKKVPKVVLDSGRLDGEAEVQSLATLVGFDPSEITPAGAELNPTKAKRLGELGSNGEKTLSEAIIAIPFYYSFLQPDVPKLMTLRADPMTLGPKIKEFRKAFTKYSLPPSLARRLEPLVPHSFPEISDYINPFGGDDYDEILAGTNLDTVPVVYMMEYGVNLSTQDLGDMWQGIMPEIGKKLQVKTTSIDHYMPQASRGNSNTPTATYPEIVLAQELDRMLPEHLRTGIPRPDLLDVSQGSTLGNGFSPEIQWLVFKVKQRGLPSYTDLIRNEVVGYNSLSYENLYGNVSWDELSPDEVVLTKQRKANHAKQVYRDLSRPTYNWPYDYCSLIETAKISSKVGFRPELDKETPDNNEGGE